jgi:hypothetical protein
MSVATLIRGLRARGVVLRPDGEVLDVEADAGVLTPADLETLRSRKAVLMAYLRWEARGRAPALLSAAWPAPGSWQHTYAVTGRHPLRCPRCGNLTLARRRGEAGPPACALGCPTGEGG